jgi:hypothetical protein
MNQTPALGVTYLTAETAAASTTMAKMGQSRAGKLCIGHARAQQVLAIHTYCWSAVAR